MDGDSAFPGQFDPDGMGFPGFHPFSGFCRIQVAAGTGIMERLLPFALFFPLGFQIRRGAEAVVGFALVHQLLAVFLIQIQPLGLVVGTVIPAHFRAFVPAQAQPFQAGDDLGDGIFLQTIPIGIFDSQDHPATLAACEQPVEQGRPGPPDMQIPSRAGGKPYTYFTHAKHLSIRIFTQIICVSVSGTLQRTWCPVCWVPRRSCPVWEPVSSWAGWAASPSGALSRRPGSAAPG